MCAWQSGRESPQNYYNAQALKGVGQHLTQACCESWGVGPLGPILDLPLDLKQVEGLVA